MRPSEVERWVVDVLERIERGLRIEDDRVELKLRLPDDPLRAARRIAGHANQARQDRILWIIGATDDPDVAERIVGVAAGDPDFADWWTQVEARFDDVAPSPVSVRVAHDSRVLLGVGFVTDRTPYVVKIPGEATTREVPWREGTRVRTANRQDLLRVLLPATRRPRLSILGGEMSIVDRGRDRGFEWQGSVLAYLDTRDGAVFPDHLCSARLFRGLAFTSFEVTCLPNRRIAFKPNSVPPPVGSTAFRSEGQLIVHRSSQVKILFGSGILDELPNFPQKGKVEFELGLAESDGAVLLFDIDFVRTATRQEEVAAWAAKPTDVH